MEATKENIIKILPEARTFLDIGSVLREHGIETSYTHATVNYGGYYTVKDDENIVIVHKESIEELDFYDVPVGNYVVGTL